jgi:hypothetical protein
MKTRFSWVFASVALTLVLAAPAVAQDADVAREGEAQAVEKMESHKEMMGEGHGCQCQCMQKMHEGMAHDGHEGHEGAEAMDSDEGQAEMMAANEKMMAGCKCMAGEDHAEGAGGMSCKMHGDGEGMQHRHGMDRTDAAAESTGG